MFRARASERGPAPTESRTPWHHHTRTETSAARAGAAARGPSPPPRRRRRARYRCAASARLFTPYRWQLAIVTAIIAASSVVGLASPFLLRAVIDTALPDKERAAAGLAGHRHGRGRRRHLGVRRHPDLDQHQGRPAGHARAAHQRLRPPAAAVDRLLHPHPHRRGPVPHHQRHRRHGVRRDLDRDLHRLQPHHRGRHRGRHGRPVLAAVAHLAGRHAAGDLPDPQGRQACAGPSPPQQQRELADLNVTIEEGLSINGVQLAKTMGTGPSLVRAVHRLLGPPDRPGAALPAGRALADGLAEHHLRRDPRDHLPRRRPAGHRRHRQPSAP